MLSKECEKSELINMTQAWEYSTGIKPVTSQTPGQKISAQNGRGNNR